MFGSAKGGRSGIAEYACAHERSLELKPAHVSFEEASTASMAALTALQGLRDKGQIQSSKKVLIYGASGGVGTFAIQTAKSFDARVTAVCSSRNLYGLILVANGNLSIFKYARALKSEGICALAGGGSGSILRILIGMLQEWWISETGNKKIGSFLASINQKDLGSMKELLASGKVEPVIDRRYSPNNTADALRYLGEGHAQGIIVIVVEHPSET